MKIQITNMRKKFPTSGFSCWSSWFNVTRYWSGKLIDISIKHFVISIDLRKDWVKDMKQ